VPSHTLLKKKTTWGPGRHHELGELLPHLHKRQKGKKEPCLLLRLYGSSFPRMDVRCEYFEKKGGKRIATRGLLLRDGDLHSLLKGGGTKGNICSISPPEEGSISDPS